MIRVSLCRRAMNGAKRPTLRCRPKFKISHTTPKSSSASNSADSAALASDQLHAYHQVLAGNNVHLSGPGGSGKSYLINILRELPATKVTAMTGTAAELIDAITWHSWSGCPTHPITSKELINKIKRNKKLLSNWTETNRLIIDEISMMSATLFNLMWLVKQSINPSLQLILVGDFCQLPPVKANRFCFQSRYWTESKIQICQLTTNHRQADKEFSTLLNQVRLGVISDKTKQILNDRIREFVPRKDGIIPTILYPDRKSVDQYNQQELDKLTDQFLIDVDITKTNLKTNQVVSKKSNVKMAVGAQVMLTQNDSNLGLVNGSRGVITGCSAEGFPLVKFLHHAKSVEIKTIITHQITNRSSTMRHKLPLKLAWAITIHKAQGATLDLVMTDLRHIFEHGQAYVTLSRVKTLDGLYLKGIKYGKITCHPDVLTFLGK